MAKPKADLSALVVPKATAAAAVPHVAPPSPAPVAGQGTAPAAPRGAPVALTVKVPATVYARLLRHCAAQGEAQGRRVTHQEVVLAAIEAALPA